MAEVLARTKANKTVNMRPNSKGFLPLVAARVMYANVCSSLRLPQYLAEACPIMSNICFRVEDFFDQLMGFTGGTVGTVVGTVPWTFSKKPLGCRNLPQGHFYGLLSLPPSPRP